MRHGMEVGVIIYGNLGRIENGSDVDTVEVEKIERTRKKSIRSGFLLNMSVTLQLN